MVLPVGGFLPIPLAMMIPFMATQSMVMGDAFGRAFQYGKRKISAMSNEEFNKTTLEEQASQMFQAYKNIIPDLSSAIDASTDLQNKVISEMLLILPKLLSSLDPTNTINTTGGNRDEILKPIVDFIGNIFNIPEAEATEVKDPPFIGPPETLPDTLKQHIEIQKELLPPPIISPKEIIVPTKVQQQSAAWNTWNRTLVNHQKGIIAAKNTIRNWSAKLTQGRSRADAFQNANAHKQIQAHQRRLTNIRVAIKKISNDYRNPNPMIQKSVIQLRREISQGLW